jgi:hypothetical protein
VRVGPPGLILENPGTNRGRVKKMVNIGFTRQGRQHVFSKSKLRANLNGKPYLQEKDTAAIITVAPDAQRT